MICKSGTCQISLQAGRRRDIVWPCSTQEAASQMPAQQRGLHVYRFADACRRLNRQRPHQGHRPDANASTIDAGDPLPPPLANSNPFSISVISHYDDRGPAWYWNNLSMGEHTGTHFDAPVHWVTGQHNPDGFTDTIPVRRMIAPAVVIDCSKEAAADEKFLLEPSHFQAWETQARAHSRTAHGY